VVDRWTTARDRSRAVSETFFTLLAEHTPTRVWVNNPTTDEVDLAIAQGAVGCTTNPAFGGGLLHRAPEEIRPIVRACAREADDDSAAADLVQQLLVAGIAGRFQGLFEDSGGQRGFTSIQGSPEADQDPRAILTEARAGLELGPNVAPKLPATAPGLEAFETLVSAGSPTIVTEVFSLAQLVETCERYVRACDRSGMRPPFFVSPITGIFGDHLRAVAKRDGLTISPDDLLLAGIVLARACHQLVLERNYPVTLLFGGARTPIDLLGLVGAPVHATINWATFAELIDAQTALGAGIEEPIDPDVVSRLETTFAEFRAALRVDGLALQAFEDFGPVQYFRNNFLAGWREVRQAVGCALRSSAPVRWAASTASRALRTATTSCC
jgi:transaldolase